MGIPRAGISRAQASQERRHPQERKQFQSAGISRAQQALQARNTHLIAGMSRAQHPKSAAS
jgi:hypothetical protein